MNVLFVSAYPCTVSMQWLLSGCGKKHAFKQMMTGLNILEAVKNITEIDPDIIFVSFDVGSASFNGIDLVFALQEGGIRAFIVENTSTKFDEFHRRGLILDFNAQENPGELALIVNLIEGKKFRHAV